MRGYSSDSLARRNGLADLIFLGRLVSEKGIDVLLEALASSDPRLVSEINDRRFRSGTVSRCSK